MTEKQTLCSMSINIFKMLTNTLHIEKKRKTEATKQKRAQQKDQLYCEQAADRKHTQTHRTKLVDSNGYVHTSDLIYILTRCECTKHINEKKKTTKKNQATNSRTESALESKFLCDIQIKSNAINEEKKTQQKITCIRPNIQMACLLTIYRINKH